MSMRDKDHRELFRRPNTRCTALIDQSQLNAFLDIANERDELETKLADEIESKRVMSVELTNRILELEAKLIDEQNATQEWRVISLCAIKKLDTAADTIGRLSDELERLKKAVPADWACTCTCCKV